MRKDAKYFVYGLADPRSGLIRYIGKATHPYRPGQHCRPSSLRYDDKNNRRKATWLRSLIDSGLSPSVVILDTIPVPVDDSELGIRGMELAIAERRLIAAYRSKGYRLLNLTDGGDNIFGPMAGRKFSKKHCSNISDALKGHPVSKETRAKLAIAASNASPETRAKIALAASNPSAETRAKLSAARRRRAPPSAATRAQMSESQRARRASEKLL